MGKNPDVQEKLYQEINTILKLNEQITEDHIAQLKYLKYSVKENLRWFYLKSTFSLFSCFNILWFTFRINSIAPSNARILHEDLVIDNYVLPKGVKLSCKYVNYII